MRGIRLTQRDLKALHRIGEQYCLRFDQLQCFLASWSPESDKMKETGVLSEEVTRRILKRWRVAELVECRLFLFGEPSWIWLTRKGLQSIGLNFRYYEPKPGELTHFYYVNQARAYVEQRWESDHWIAERFLRMQQESQQKGDMAEHRPDGILVKPDGGHIAVEVELRLKSKTRYISLLREIQPKYHRVWYFASTSVVAVLQDVLVRALNEEQRKTIQVLPLEEHL